MGLLESDNLTICRCDHNLLLNFHPSTAAMPRTERENMYGAPKLVPITIILPVRVMKTRGKARTHQSITTASHPTMILATCANMGIGVDRGMNRRVVRARARERLIDILTDRDREIER